MIIECIYVPTIIGVAGTLSGVILGFLLNLLIRIGRIKIFINNINCSFSYFDDNGNPLQTDTMDSNSTSVEIKINLDFYNTSSFNQKIGRDFYLIFKTTEGDIKKEMTYRNERFKNINLKPNELINYDLDACLNDDCRICMNSEFYLEYKDSKNCNIRKKIKSIR